MDSSTSSAISTLVIRSIIDRLHLNCHRSSTKKNYYTVWRLFNQFYIRLDNKPDNWEDRIILFVGYLIDNGKKSTTVKSYVSAIKSVLHDDNIIVNEDRCLLNALTKACRYHNDQIRTRLPIGRGLLNLINSSIRNSIYENQPYLACMYIALMSTAYFGLFRVGELTESQHAIKADDIHIGENKDKLMFVLHTSKTHCHDVKPQVVKISSVSNPEGCTAHQRLFCTSASDLTCPFTLLHNYIRMHKQIKQPDEQLFIFRDCSPVKSVHMRSVLNQALTHNGLDPRNYGCHSYRIGRAVDLYTHMNLDVGSIRKLGRWWSNIVYSYLR